MIEPPGRRDGFSAAARWQTSILFLGLVVLVGLIAWPSFIGRIQYARTRAELAAIADAAAGARLAPVAKLFTTLARLVGPAVVNVTADRRLRSFADEIAALHGLPQQPGVNDESIGSGVIIEPDGVILTNYHVVARADRVAVTLADGRRFAARLVGADAGTDLAVLEIDAKELPAAAWGDSDQIEVGEMVWAIGNPFGLDRTLTYGIVSGVGRRGVVDDPFQE
ncbi:MAG: putative periplasmic serine endoprotease DegP-like precursor, partial [Planctomycetota bacterium]